MELLLLPLTLLMAFPGAALLPGIAFGLWLAVRWRGLPPRRRGTATVGVILWLLYGAYETRMWFWMQTVSAPIRVDLLLIAPLLLLATLMVLLALMGRGRGDARPRHQG